MSARTSLVLADVAWARPDNLGQVVDAILGYSGPAFPGIDWIRHWGKPFLLGFESSTTRAYAGGDAGAEDARQLIDVARTLPGYVESGCGLWWCSADSPSTPAWALPGCTEYGRRFVLECLTADWRPTITLPYGNRAASSAGVTGAIAAGVTSAMWGVGTWDFNEGRGAYQLPDDSDAAVLQSANTPGPADGTDYDALYRPLEELGFYGGPIAAPIPRGRPEMFVGLKQRGTSNVYDAAWVDGGVVIRWFDADELAPLGFLQVPKPALDFAEREPKCRIEVVSEWDAIEQRTAATRVKPGTLTLTNAQLEELGAKIAGAVTLDPTSIGTAVTHAVGAALVNG